MQVALLGLTACALTARRSGQSTGAVILRRRLVSTSHQRNQLFGNQPTSLLTGSVWRFNPRWAFLAVTRQILSFSNKLADSVHEAVI